MSDVAIRTMHSSYSQGSLCFSFILRDFNFLLFFYNISFFLQRELMRSDYTACFLMSFLIFLTLLFVISFEDLLEILNNEVTREKHEGSLIVKKIRNEYQKMFRMNYKKELLKKVNNCEKENTPTVSEINKPKTNSESRANTSEIVHFNYLNRHSTARPHFRDL